jgi:hypothetical protein
MKLSAVFERYCIGHKEVVQWALAERAKNVPFMVLLPGPGAEPILLEMQMVINNPMA